MDTSYQRGTNGMDEKRDHQEPENQSSNMDSEEQTTPSSPQGKSSGGGESLPEVKEPYQGAAKRVGGPRITLAETVLYESGEGEPRAMVTRFSRVVKHPHQAFVRYFRLGYSWSPLDLGWVGDPGMILIANQGTLTLEGTPSDTQEPLIVGVLPEGVNLGDPDPSHKPRPVTMYDEDEPQPVCTPLPIMVVPPYEGARITPTKGTRYYLFNGSKSEVKVAVEVYPQ